jgi:hypothetical protein
MREVIVITNLRSVVAPAAKSDFSAPRSPRRRSRPLVAAFAGIVLTFILTACGARIDTTMNVSDTGSGERVMVLTLGSSDLSKLTGGPAAADASIRRHLPASVSYSGMQPDKDGNQTATLTLAFASTADYKNKVSELINAGGINAGEIDFSVSDSVLVKGITLQESNSSADLLKWMFDGLIADHVVSSSDSSNLYEMGTSVVKFGGATIQQSNPFSVSRVANNGFDSVTMKTQIADVNQVTRTLTYTAAGTRYSANKDVFAKFFDQSTQDGAKVSTPSPGVWELTFSGDPKTIASSTSRALGGAPATFALDLSDTPADPSEKVLTATDTASCDAVCATTTQIRDAVSTPENFTPRNLDVDTSAHEAATFAFAPPMKSIAATFGFGMDGSVTAKVNVVVPKASTDAVGDGFAKKLRPSDGVGTLETAKDDTNSTYTVSISGKDFKDFAAKYGQWAPGSSVTQSEKDSGLFVHQSSYAINPALQNLSGHHPITDGATSEISLPFGQWVSSSAGAEQSVGVAGSTVTVHGLETAVSVQTNSLTVGGLITFVVLLGAAAFGAYLLIRHRAALFKRLRAFRDQTNAGLAEQRLLLFDKTAVHGTNAGVAAGSVLRLRDEQLRPADRTSTLELRAPATPSPPLWNLVDAPPPRARVAPQSSLFDIEHTQEPRTRPSLFV